MQIIISSFHSSINHGHCMKAWKEKRNLFPIFYYLRFVLYINSQQTQTKQKIKVSNNKNAENNLPRP